VGELVVVETRSKTEHYTGVALMFGFALAFARYIEKESSLGT
jgi:putative copper export protein